MTVGFHELVIGDCVEMKGPIGSFTWEGTGLARWKGVQRTVKNIGLICGGSGITPILQVIRAVLNDHEDKETRMWLLDANKTEDDILCREELETLCQQHTSERFRLHYTVEQVPQCWRYSTGRISDTMLKEHLPPPSDDSLILTCGPGPMIKYAVQPGLERLGWDTARALVIF